MATLTKRKRKDGSLAWRAEVRLVIGGEPVRRVKTFDQRRHALAWMLHTKDDLKNPKPKPFLDTVGDLINRYLAEVHAIKPLGRTRKEILRALAKMPIAGLPAAELTVEALKAHCQARAAVRQNRTGHHPA